jgi:hypothetical protein
LAEVLVAAGGFRVRKVSEILGFQEKPRHLPISKNKLYGVLY